MRAVVPASGGGGGGGAGALIELHRAALRVPTRVIRVDVSYREQRKKGGEKKNFNGLHSTCHYATPGHPLSLPYNGSTLKLRFNYGLSSLRGITSSCVISMHHATHDKDIFARPIVF